MVLKFLGLGKSKKSEYFLEAEPQPSNGAEATAKADLPAKSAPETNKKEAKAEAKAETSAPAKVVAAATEVTATAAKATEALASKVTQATKTTQSKAKASKKDAPAPVEKVVPVAKIDTTPKAVTNFATDHLLPNNTPRRRPGPSLDVFKEMARQVNNRK